MLNSFLIIERVETFYRLQLSEFIRVYNVFHLHLLRKDFNNFLFKQIQKPPSLIITKKSKEYKLNNVENF